MINLRFKSRKFNKLINLGKTNEPLGIIINSSDRQDRYWQKTETLKSSLIAYHKPSQSTKYFSLFKQKIALKV